MRIFGAVACLAALGLAVASPAKAQTIAAKNSYVSPLPFFKDLKPWDPNYQPPRTPEGRPDLQGVWSNASLTAMTRTNRGAKLEIDTLVIPQEKINQLTANASYTKSAASSQDVTDPNAGVFTDRNVDAGYNAFWIDPGSEYAKVDSEWRSSWITSPDTGQVPFTPEGRALRSNRMTSVKNIPNTGPEIRPLGERCLASFGSQAGPPLTNAMYNNNYQFVQTSGALMINTEMNHDVRILNIAASPENARRRPDEVKQWFGDSIAHWEGDTLVVETRNLNPTQLQVGAFPVSPKGRVVERFRRVSDDVIDYQFSVEDPAYYTQAWTGQMPLRRSKEKLYEYACHEGNYAMPGILRADAKGKDTAIGAEGE